MEAHPPLLAGQAVLRQAEEQPRRPQVAVEVPPHQPPRPLVVARLAAEPRRLLVAAHQPQPPPLAVGLRPQPPAAMQPRLLAADVVVPQRPVEALHPLLAPLDRAPEETAAIETLMTGGSISKQIGLSSDGATMAGSGTGRSDASGADGGTSTGSAAAGSRPRSVSFGFAAEAPRTSRR